MAPTADSHTARVVCVTGASSGVGRATALMLASRRASLALVARSADGLEEVAAACRARGARCITVPTDVADEGAVRRATEIAEREYGRLDAWINNAGVIAVGRFEETPPEVFRRVVETNFFGYVHGARAALSCFRRQGRGILVNNASSLGTVGAPYLSAYVASKFAIRGFSESLRHEMRGDPRIHVCTVLPASLDTPIWRHAANFTGRALRPVPPVYPAETAARAIVGLLGRPRAEVVVGRFGWVMRLGRLAPKPVLDAASVLYARTGFRREAAPPTTGSLFTASPDGVSLDDSTAGGTTFAEHRTP